MAEQVGEGRQVLLQPRQQALEERSLPLLVDRRQVAEVRKLHRRQHRQGQPLLLTAAGDVGVSQQLIDQIAQGGELEGDRPRIAPVRQQQVEDRRRLSAGDMRRR
jgi:hypothetical protein